MTITRQVPDEIRELLSDSLTEHGLAQWWNSRLRYLDGHRPAEWWEEHREDVIKAAHAWAEGTYV